MLRGTNSLHLNFATASKAIEEYLNDRLVLSAKIRVSSIKAVNDEIVVKIEAMESSEGGAA
jgi:hypothetical protein